MRITAYPTDVRAVTGFSRHAQALGLLLMALAQIVAAQAPYILGWPDTVASQAYALKTPLVPQGYTFAIWGVIYLWSLIFAVWQALPRQLHNPVIRAIGWPLAGVYLANSLWSLWVPLNGVDVISLLIITLGVSLGSLALLRLTKIPHVLNRAETGMILMPTALVTGWISAAAFVNAASTARGLAIPGVDPAQTGVAIVFLLAALAFGLTLTRVSRQFFYAAAQVWALQGIVVANLKADSTIASLAGGGIVLVVITLIWAKRPNMA